MTRLDTHTTYHATGTYDGERPDGDLRYTHTADDGWTLTNHTTGEVYGDNIPDTIVAADILTATYCPDCDRITDAATDNIGPGTYDDRPCPDCYDDRRTDAIHRRYRDHHLDPHEARQNILDAAGL